MVASISETTCFEQLYIFFLCFISFIMAAEKDLKTTALENSQTQSGTFYGADNSVYSRNYQVFTFPFFLDIFFWGLKHCLAAIGS